MIDCCDRCLDRSVDGAVNFRDLGGHRAGVMRVRRGLLYRSAMTHGITAAGIQVLAGRYGLRTVIDLRSEEEIAEYGVAPFVDAGVAYHHAPVISRGRSAPAEIVARYQQEMREGRFDWTASYLRMVENGGDALRRVFEVLAAPGTLPAVFHCIAGRDRTGVAAALLLATLGVNAEEIASDYALTGTHLRSHAHRFARQAERMNLTQDQMARILETDATAMHRFLGEVNRRYGSADAALQTIGVHPPTLTTLRETLLEPA
jgi:protein-tyrosine phosphatase